MAKLAELSKLFHAISAHDWRVAQELALEVADSEAARGNHAAASRLRGALKPNGTRNGTPNSGPPVEPASAVGILTELPPLRGLETVSLRPRQRTELNALLKEWRLRDKLLHHGVRRRSKILFFGPPGVRQKHGGQSACP